MSVQYNQPSSERRQVRSPGSTSVNSLSPLRLTTLGGAELTREEDGQRLVLLGPGKPLAMLVYLAASPGRSARREHLLDQLWSDVEPDAGRHALRQMVLYVKQRVDPRLLVATRDSIALAQPISFDRAEFLAAAERQDCDAVIALYGGDFLPNIALPGGGEFELWADLERQRLKSAFLRCADAIVRKQLGSGRHRDAIALARRLREVDPHSEHVWRLLIEALLSANDRLSASAEADSLTRHFVAEEREIEPATRAILRRASAEPDSHGADTAPHPIAELIGRAEEFKRLVAGWDDTRRGGFRHMHLVAPSGIGKSRLLADFAARLRAKGVRVATARARPGDRTLSQSAIGDVAAALAQLPGAAGISADAARCIVALHPPLSSQFAVDPDLATGDESIRRRGIALHELAVAVTDDAPAALLLDDVHWYDDVSRQMLTSLLQRLTSERLFVVTAVRPRYLAPTSGKSSEIQLQPFNAAQVGAFLASVASLPDRAWAQQLADDLHRATDGSPLLLIEALQMLRERGHLSVVDASWHAPDPRSLLESLRAHGASTWRLSRLQPSERELLALLSVAGVPLREAMIAAATERAESELRNELALLEQRGFLMRSDDGWLPAHDAIAELLLSSEGETELRAVHRRLSRAHLAGSPDMDSLLRAGRHCAEIDDAAGAREAFRRWLGARRRLGDTRAVGPLAQEFAGADHERLALALARSAPLHLRVSRRVLLGASGVVAAALLVIPIMRSTTGAQVPPPDGILELLQQDSSGDSKHYRLALRRQEFSGEDAIELRTRPLADGIMPQSSYMSNIAPDSAHWLLERVYADSGGFDLLLKDTRNGRETRLTHHTADDLGSSWSPDGRFVVFSSGRFNHLHHPNLAILDVATGAVRQLTTTLASDGDPRWSPSGGAIAFRRKYWDRPGPDQLCTVTPDGRHTDCFALGPQAHPVPIGWHDAEHLIVTNAEINEVQRALAVVDVNTHEVRKLGDFLTGAAALSPDGSMIVCQCRPGGNANSAMRTIVFAVEAPERYQEIRAGTIRDDVLRATWSGPIAPKRWASRLQVDAPLIAPANAATQLLASAFDPRGEAVRGIRVSWRSLAPDVAVVDSNGLLTPSRPGTVPVEVSGSGWIVDTAVIRIGRTTVDTILHDRLTGALERQFIPFGTPKPFLQGDTLTPLRINGDSSFTSGVYTRQSFDASAGLAVEVLASTPLTVNQWQTFGVDIFPDRDDERFRHWDHATGGLPRTYWRDVAWCAAGMPYGEGYGALDHWALGHVGGTLSLPLPAWQRTGRRYRLRLELLPDGSCGVAVDSRPVIFLPAVKPPRGRYRVAIAAMSMWTSIAVGDVRIMQGVDSRIDWRAAPRH